MQMIFLGLKSVKVDFKEHKSFIPMKIGCRKREEKKNWTKLPPSHRQEPTVRKGRSRHRLPQMEMRSLQTTHLDHIKQKKIKARP